MRKSDVRKARSEAIWLVYPPPSMIVFPKIDLTLQEVRLIQNLFSLKLVLKEGADKMPCFNT